MSFHFRCPACNAKLEAEDEWDGLETTCPSCSVQITISKQTEPIPLSSTIASSLPLSKKNLLRNKRILWTAIPVLLVIITGIGFICWGIFGKRSVHRDTLVERDGITYEANSQTPYSGYATDSFANGEKIKFEYKNGKLNGPYISYAASGQIVSIAYYKDGKDQKGIQYYDNGAKRLEYQVHGGASGYGEAISYYPTGELLEKYKYTPYLRLWKEGELIEYYKSGQIKAKKNYENGKLNGEYISYYENGQPETTATYYNDIPRNVVKYHSDGRRK
ncbi:toxin-antitoxin system YwqK family antitoxin [Victivallis lenta]|nr:toxin-antitoxin system YwqK family antitoxin [Victivallis lenta]